MATVDFSQKLLSVLSDISGSLVRLPFWQNFDFWNIIILAITLFWLIKYTHATEKMAENQMMPAVDVNMVYEKFVQKTYFWFLNASIVPATVLIKLKTNNNKECKILELRIPPYHPNHRQSRKTATSFDFLEGRDDVEVTLNITIMPAFNKNYGKLELTKSYKFNATNFCWDETTWGYPDPKFPS